MKYLIQSLTTMNIVLLWFRRCVMASREYAEYHYKLCLQDIERKRARGCYCNECADTRLIPDIQQVGDNNYIFGFRSCKCVNAAITKQTIKQSGLADEIKNKTFSSYVTSDSWQQKIKDMAIDYLNTIANGDRKWFFIGGQSGAGKTHICTAIANRFLKKNYNLRYMSWVQDIRQMKMDFNDNNKINEFKTCEILYIDDLFKGSDNPSSYDKSLAFEIINYRENNRLITIISSEMTSFKLKNIDEAIYSRIKLNAGKYAIDIPADANRNRRVR